MARSRAVSLGRVAALAGGAAVAGLAVAGVVDRLRLRDDPEYRELSRPLDGRTRTVTSADGTRLNAAVFGDEDAPTLVLLHGWTEALGFWHPQIVELSRDHRVVAVDLRGHGASEAGEFSTDALADDLSAVLAACVPAGDRAVLVGHSMGAMAIVAWAARHPDELGRAAGAVLVATGMGDLVEESRVLPDLPGPLVRARRLASASALTTAPVSPGWLAPVSRRAVRHITLGPRATAAQTAFCHDVVMGCPRSTWTGWGRVLTTLDLTESVPALRVPTLVMAGGSDRLTPPDHARRLERTLPQPAGLVIIPGAGHMLPVEAADEVNSRVRAFSRDLLGAAATGT